MWIHVYLSRFEQLTRRISDSFRGLDCVQYIQQGTDIDYPILTVSG
jgi:hypothetical protein